MRTQSLFSTLAVATAVAAQTQDAPVIKNNPIGAQYEAILEAKKPWNVAGSVQISTKADGEGVTVQIALAGFPAEGGPFMYHIHEKPVPEDGNCTGTGAHLDPYKRGEVPLCDASKPETCQTGDLSGKHGNNTEATFSTVYNDAYLATVKSDLSFFGNLSVVVHLSNKTRIACANFKEISAGSTPVSITSSASASYGTSYGTALPSGSATGGRNSSTTATATSGSESTTGSPIQPTASPSTTSPPEQGGDGHKLVAGGAALFAFAALLML